MKEMKIRKKLVIGMIMLAIACFGIGVMMTTSFSVKAETQGLTGFTSPGASVFIATDDTDTKQMRFQVNLDTTADETYKTAAANKSLQSGVVVLPYDIYQAEGYTELTKDTEKAVTADVTKNWTANENGYESYAYLPVDLIPQDQYNRVLIARGYVIDGENVYYTEPVRASMAYVAWKNLGMAEGAYDMTLRSYMGPYTLTYGTGENEKIENLYYGDELSLPTNINGYDVEGWFWDEDCTNAITDTDYATGSMSVYYKFREFTVSGTVTCADSVDLTTVRILVDGVEKDATVDASGAYSVSVESGTHDFAFYCEGYKAYALNTVVSKDSTLNAELKSDLYEIGNFGSVENTPNLVPEDDFDGTYTVTGNPYLLMMPNTATTGAFTYTVKVSNLTAGRGDKAFAASVSNGAYALSIGLYQWETIVVNLSSVAGAAFIGYYDLSGVQQYIDGASIKIVRTESAIEVYVLDRLYFTFTSAGITPADGVTDRNWGNSFVTNQDKLAGFFGENVRLACGIAALQGSAFTATYTCNVAKHVAVSGTVSCADSVDLTTVRILVDGVEKDATIDASGAYSVSVESGTHDFAFYCEGYKAYALNTVVSKDSTLNAELKSDLYEIGNFGSVENTPNLVPEDDFDGTYTVTGNPYLLMMPNTATTGAFTYTVKVSNLTAGRGDKAFAASVSNGAYALSIGLYQWETIVVNLSSVAGAAFIGYYDLSGVQQYIDGASIKIVRTESAIEVYVLDRLYFTFTSAGITPADGVTDRNWGNSFVTNQDKLAGFFGENVRLACGIAALQGSAFTATYTCNVAKHVAVSGTISAPAEVPVANTTLKVDGIDTPISVNADGTYTASVPEGTHTFLFENGNYVGTKEITVVGGDVIDVTLVYATWRAGNYGAVNGNNTPAFNESGKYTISGANQLVVFPNTATSTPFTYTVAVSNVTRSEATTQIGICLTDGNYKLAVAYRPQSEAKTTAFSVS